MVAYFISNMYEDAAKPLERFNSDHNRKIIRRKVWKSL